MCYNKHMDVRIKTNDYQMTPETHAYIEERVASFAKLLGGHDDVARCEVEVGKDAGGQRHGANLWFAEMHVVYPHGSVFARNNSESINGAIDDAKEEVMRQLRRDKQLHVRLMRRGARLAKRLIRFGGTD